MDGLRRLEYRGYDSAGVATLAPDGEIAVTKTVGRIAPGGGAQKRGGEHQTLADRPGRNLLKLS